MSTSYSVLSAVPLQNAFAAVTAPVLVVFLYSVWLVVCFIQRVANDQPHVTTGIKRALSSARAWMRRTILIIALTTVITIATNDAPGQPLSYIAGAAVAHVSHYATR